MIDANDLTRAFARNVGIVKAQTEGLTHEDSLIQQPRGNCLNWVVGHITADRDDIRELLGEPRLMGAVGHRYERESDPMSTGDPGMLRLEDLLARLDQAQERIAAALVGMDEAALAREITRGERTTTV